MKKRKSNKKNPCPARSNPGRRRILPPALGPASAAAVSRMKEIWTALESREIEFKRRYGSRAKEIEARTAWTEFKKDFCKRAGRWVRKNPADADEVEAGKKLYEKFHWGREADKQDRGQMQISKVVASLGPIRAIEYEAKKGKNGKPTIWRHSFKRPYPILTSSPDGKQLYITGGGYAVRPEGIIN